MLCAERRFLVTSSSQKPDIHQSCTSQILARAKAFLPNLQLANERLATDACLKPRDSFDIEALSSEEGPYIQMDLGCGVFDLQDPPAEAAARAASNCPSLPAAGPASSDDSPSSSLEQESEGDIASAGQRQDTVARRRRRKPLQKRAAILQL